MANEPRHITEQAVRKEDAAHMSKTDEDRRAEADERARDQFGDPAERVSPDVYPSYSGDTSLTERDESDNQTPAGQNNRTLATNADDHKEKVGKDGMTKSAKDSVKASSSSSSSSSGSSSTSKS